MSDYLLPIVQVSSLILAFTVYRFNFKKDSFSKLSLEANKLKSEVSTEHYSLGNPELLELPMYLNSLNDDHVYYSDIKNETKRFKSTYGYPLHDTYHPVYDWYIEFSNKGHFDTVGIEIDYTIITYKLAYKFNGDVNKPSNYELVEGDKIRKKEFISYISSDDSKKIFICKLYGAFAKADLVVNSLKSKKMNHIKSPIKLDTYVSPYLTALSYIDVSLLLSLAGKELSDDLQLQSFPQELIATETIQNEGW